ncbi:MAG: hypothetical protein HOZ81_10360 [Streptomyces sp.]|nr:hypothetical protein [Streptomyces sp.]
MYQLPEHQQHAPAGQPNAQAQQIIRAIEDVYATPTSYRDDTPLPAVGDTPPVPQPGRPPMSQKATDASALMLAAGATTVMVSGSAAGLMYVSQFADPVVCSLVLGAPVALVLAVARLATKAKQVIEAAPAPVHHHYQGPVTVDQRSINSSTRGVIANTRNQGAA